MALQLKKIGRNDPCPCGSGKKFKKCHMGREGELPLDGLGEISLEMSTTITSLPAVSYGRSEEILKDLDIEKLTGSSIGIKFVDLKSYTDLNLFGSGRATGTDRGSGGVLINLHKTKKADPDNIYIAVSRDIDDSILVHELAHVLDYLGGSGLMPGTLQALSFESDVPVDHLEHPREFGYWLDFLVDKFDVCLDADDTVISYLYKNKMLLEGKEIQGGNRSVLKTRSDAIFRFLSENSQEINTLIRGLPGYIGSREVKD